MGMSQLIPAQLPLDSELDFVAPRFTLVYRENGVWNTRWRDNHPLTVENDDVLRSSMENAVLFEDQPAIDQFLAEADLAGEGPRIQRAVRRIRSIPGQVQVLTLQELQESLSGLLEGDLNCNGENNEQKFQSLLATPVRKPFHGEYGYPVRHSWKNTLWHVGAEAEIGSFWPLRILANQVAAQQTVSLGHFKAGAQWVNLGILTGIDLMPSNQTRAMFKWSEHLLFLPDEHLQAVPRVEQFWPASDDDTRPAFLLEPTGQPLTVTGWVRTVPESEAVLETPGRYRAARWPVPREPEPVDRRLPLDVMTAAKLSH